MVLGSVLTSYYGSVTESRFLSRNAAFPSTLVFSMPWELLWWWRACWVLVTTSVPTTPTSNLVRPPVNYRTTFDIRNYEPVIWYLNKFKASRCIWTFEFSSSLNLLMFWSFSVLGSNGLQRFPSSVRMFCFFFQILLSCTWLLGCVCWSCIRRDTQTSMQALTLPTPAWLWSSSFLCWEWCVLHFSVIASRFWYSGYQCWWCLQVFGKGNMVFWIVFSVIHILATLLLSTQLYYMGRWRLGKITTLKALYPLKCAAAASLVIHFSEVPICC